MINSAPLQFVQVTKRFPFGENQKDALKDLNFSLLAGSITGLLGPDGAGKSTLMRLAAGLFLPDEGKVLTLGVDSKQQAAYIQSNIGYMPQFFGLYEDLTVQENFDLYADLQGLSQSESLNRQKQLLNMTGLGSFTNRRAKDLSGGMKQKLGLACVLLRKPRLLLLDEPTVGVDPISRRELWSIVQDVKKNGGTVLISTAYFDEAEKCDAIILLNEGKLLRFETPDAFRLPLIGQTYLVNKPHLSRRALQGQLLHRPQMIDARIVTEGVRVLCSDKKPHPQNKEIWKQVRPSFEDVFVSLLGRRHDAPIMPEKTEIKEVSQVRKILDTDSHRQGTALSTSLSHSSETMIEIKNLSRFFGNFAAVKEISFEVKKGEIFGLLGANGAGKTTAFRMLCGLLQPTSGKLSVAGVNMLHAPAEARARMGYVSQKFSLYGNLSIFQNLQFFSAAYGLRNQKQKERLDWAREEFQLQEYWNINVETLPFGIKQRLALSCALLHDPLILFLDEPTSGVDPLTRREFWMRINHLAQKDVTILITTHFMDEAEYCDQLVLMSSGEVLAYGTPEQIRAKARDDNHPAPDMNDAFICLIQAHEALRQHKL